MFDSIPNKYEEFFSEPRTERLKLYHSYSLRDQYEIMQIGNSVIHPPMIELADDFAGNGSRVVSILKENLIQAEEGISVRNIAYVLVSMKRQKVYDGSKDGELLSLLTRKSEERRSIWTESTQGLIQELNKSNMKAEKAGA